MVRLLTLLIFTLGLLSCSTSKTKLSSKGGKVRVLTYKKNSGCQVVDKVVGINEKGSEDLAKNHARNLAAKVGGNGIYFDEYVDNGNEIKVYATAYQCEE